MEHIITKGTAWDVDGVTLATFKVTDAITKEHAISLAAHEAYAKGFGDWELHQVYFTLEDGAEIWHVQYKEAGE